MALSPTVRCWEKNSRPVFSTNCCLPPKKKINTRSANTSRKTIPIPQILSQELSTRCWIWPMRRLSRNSKESSDGGERNSGFDLFFHGCSLHPIAFCVPRAAFHPEYRPLLQTVPQTTVNTYTASYTVPPDAFDKRVGRRSLSAEYKAFTSFRVRCFSHKTRTFLDGNGLYPFHITLSALWKNPQTRVRYSGSPPFSPHFSSMPNSSEVVRTMSNPHASSDGLTKSG